MAADGTFVLVVDEAGPLRLSLAPPAELGTSGRIDVRLALQPGENTWRADLAMGRLSGHLLGGTPGPERALFWTSAEGAEPSSWLPTEPDEAGRFALPLLPAGRGSIRAMEERNGEWAWTTLLESEVSAGGERVVEVP